MKMKRSLLGKIKDVLLHTRIHDGRYVFPSNRFLVTQRKRKKKEEKQREENKERKKERKNKKRRCRKNIDKKQSMT